MYKTVVKRFLDVILAIILFGIALIPMLIIAILVKTTSEGPVLFKQKRYGMNSEPFYIYKFRTMLISAPNKSNKHFENIQCYFTPIGGVLRETSLDELPQLINILSGKMSFIGPRPLADTDSVVLNLRASSGADKVFPGITGWAQVNGRNDVSDVEKARLDLYYKDKVSLCLDVKIVFMTLQKVFLREGINAS